MGSVSVVGYRQLIEPPVMGTCQDPHCRTLAAMGTSELILVATYSSRPLSTGAPESQIRVCSTCDERRLRAWLEDES